MLADAAQCNGTSIHAKSVGDRKQVDLPQRIKLLELMLVAGMLRVHMRDALLHLAHI